MNRRSFIKALSAVPALLCCGSVLAGATKELKPDVNSSLFEYTYDGVRFNPPPGNFVYFGDKLPSYRWDEHSQRLFRVSSTLKRNEPFKME